MPGVSGDTCITRLLSISKMLFSTVWCLREPTLTHSVVPLALGLRAGELASLTPASFDFASSTATVRVLAAYTKNGEEAEILLRDDLAAMLHKWIGHGPADGPLRPRAWAQKASAKMMRMDLAAAGIPYQDASGQYADFHSLRHTFVSNLARAGTHPKTAMELARHKKLELTLGVYTHTLRSDKVRALDALPAIPDGTGPESEKAAVAATGTEDRHAPVRAQYARKADFRGRTEEDRGNAWQHRPTSPRGAVEERKGLRLAEISTACQAVTGPVSRRGRRDSNPQPPDRQSGTLAT